MAISDGPGVALKGLLRAQTSSRAIFRASLCVVQKRGGGRASCPFSWRYETSSAQEANPQYVHSDVPDKSPVAGAAISKLKRTGRVMGSGLGEGWQLFPNKSPAGVVMGEDGNQANIMLSDHPHLPKRAQIRIAS